VSPTTTRTPRGTARLLLLDAAVDVIRAKGYSATTVDELCNAAGVTKGAFFHHFDSKDDLAVAAAEHWTATTSAMFASAPFHDHDSPTDRVLAYVRFRAEMIGGAIEAFTCLAGTLTQEVFASHPAIRDACGSSIFGHAATLEADIDAALTDAARADGITAASVATHMQAVLQGGFVLAKAADDPRLVLDSLDHLHRYLTGILEPLHGAAAEPAMPAV
jgi:TetR/AcrR family transcriptional repressor of nem operon